MSESQNVTRRLQIGHVFIGNSIGGCESCCRAVMAHSEGAEHHVLFFASSGPSSEFLEPYSKSQTHHPLSSRDFRGYRNTVLAWARGLGLEGAILWHGMIALPPLIQGLERAGTACLVHGGNPCVSTSWKQDAKFLLLERFFPSKALPIYFTCSNYVANSYDKSSYLKRFPRRVILNGAAFKSPTFPPLLKQNVPMTLGMTARLDPGKNHALLLKAFALARKNSPPLKLELLGDGDLRETLEKQAQALGIEKDVHFLGTRMHVTETMRHWDIFAYATTEFEGFGNSLAEAMSMGLPCVVTDVGPIPEVIGTPPTALLCKNDSPEEFAAGILQLVESSALRADLGHRAQQWALENYSPELYAKRVLDLLIHQN